jgi:CRISPR system Cascade subunit CasC
MLKVQKIMSKFLNISMIQAIPINCINRDDLGNIKTADFGGAIRQRVSSQAFKNVIRSTMENTTDLTWRSKRIPQKLYDALIERGINSFDTFKKVGEIFTGIKGKGKGKVRLEIEDSSDKPILWNDFLKREPLILNPDEKIVTSSLYFISKNELDSIVESCIGNDTKTINDILNDGKKRYGASIALFGRMMADFPDLDIASASSFAHTITTHEIVQDSDYFSAMDDLKDEPGAGYLDQTSFSSGTFYRHIVLDIETLRDNLQYTEGDIPKLVGRFIEASIKAFPQGKKNSFYARTLPAKVIIDVTPLPISLANAFETPIVSNNGYLVKSISSLKSHREELIREGYEVESSFESGTIGDAIKFTEDNTTIILNTLKQKD